MLSSGTRLWPPARTFASASPAEQRDGLVDALRRRVVERRAASSPRLRACPPSSRPSAGGRCGPCCGSSGRRPPRPGSRARRSTSPPRNFSTCSVPKITSWRPCSEQRGAGDAVGHGGEVDRGAQVLDGALGVLDAGDVDEPGPRVRGHRVEVGEVEAGAPGDAGREAVVARGGLRRVVAAEAATEDADALGVDLRPPLPSSSRTARRVALEVGPELDLEEHLALPGPVEGEGGQPALEAEVLEPVALLLGALEAADQHAAGDRRRRRRPAAAAGSPGSSRPRRRSRRAPPAGQKCGAARSNSSTLRRWPGLAALGVVEPHELGVVGAQRRVPEPLAARDAVARRRRASLAQLGVVVRPRHPQVEPVDVGVLGGRRLGRARCRARECRRRASAPG